MVHHISLIKLKKDVDSETIENLMVESRIRLLKIPEVMNLRTGKCINKNENTYDVFISMDFENMAKLENAYESDIYVTFEHKILTPHTEEIKHLNYEMEPGKDVQYS